MGGGASALVGSHLILSLILLVAEIQVLCSLVADTRLHLAVTVGRSVRRYITFLNSERFLHYCSCPTVRDWIVVYLALLISTDVNGASMVFASFLF